MYYGTGSLSDPGRGLARLALLGHMRMGAAVFVAKWIVDRHSRLSRRDVPFPRQRKGGWAASLLGPWARSVVGCGEAGTEAW